MSAPLRWMLAAVAAATLLGVCAPQAHADELSPVARKLAKGLRKLETKRIAVLPFSYPNGGLSSGSSLVAERLTTLLVDREGVQVIERALLDKTMGELKFGLSGAVDPATTQQLGKVLGVTAIVTGSLNDSADRETEVNARLIQTETGAILAAGRTVIERTWQDPPRPPAGAAAAPKEEEPTVHMSKLIPVSGPRTRRPPPVYTGIVRGDEPAPPSGGGILTLNNDDLVPISHRDQTDPERILRDYMVESNPPPQAIHVARRLYVRHPDPRVRGKALLALGHLYERRGEPDHAAQAYRQVQREFSEDPGLQDAAREQLGQLMAVRPEPDRER